MEMCINTTKINHSKLVIDYLAQLLYIFIVCFMCRNLILHKNLYSADFFVVLYFHQ